MVHRLASLFFNLYHFSKREGSNSKIGRLLAGPLHEFGWLLTAAVFPIILLRLQLRLLLHPPTLLLIWTTILAPQWLLDGQLLAWPLQCSLVLSSGHPPALPGLQSLQLSLQVKFVQLLHPPLHAHRPSLLLLNWPLTYSPMHTHWLTIDYGITAVRILPTCLLESGISIYGFEPHIVLNTPVCQRFCVQFIVCTIMLE